jgi:hypothetical protein
MVLDYLGQDSRWLAYGARSLVMMLAKARLFPALAVVASASMLACGGDSIAPGAIEPNAALQSLALGLEAAGLGTSTPDASGFFDGIGSLLDHATVTIDGTSQNMFALGVRQTFPAGTCEETLFINPAFPPEPGICTPPQSGLTLILWQAHSGTVPPDRLIFISADAGTSSFDAISAAYLTPGVAPAASVMPAFALYMQGEDNIWGALSGTLTSQTTATSQSCNLPLPPYAKSGTCSIAMFDEQGQIVFQPFSPDGQIGTQRTTIVIPHQTLHGLLLAISEVQPVPIPLTGYQLEPGLPRAHSGVAPYLTPAR